MPHPQPTTIKKLRFFPQVNVILIPTKEEFQAAILQGIIPNLWWRKADYDSFKEEARKELPNIEEENLPADYLNLQP